MKFLVDLEKEEIIEALGEYTPLNLEVREKGAAIEAFQEGGEKILSIYDHDIGIAGRSKSRVVIESKVDKQTKTSIKNFIRSRE